jgi:hypothetical protein
MRHVRNGLIEMITEPVIEVPIASLAWIADTVLFGVV